MENTTSHRNVLIKSLLGAAVMFMSAIFVLPPLYDLFARLLASVVKRAMRTLQLK